MSVWYNDNMHKGLGKSGFTMVELSLSMIFISVLSIAVVVVIAGAISSYHKGLTLDKINSVGMDLVDDMRSVVQASPAKNLRDACYTWYNASSDAATKCENDEAKNFVSVARYAKVAVGGKEIGGSNGIPVFGAFCTGDYSYIWNSGYFFDSENYEVNSGNLAAASLKYSMTGNATGTKTKEGFKLLKVKDDSRAVCVAAVTGKGNGTRDDNYFVIPNGSLTRAINNGSSVFDISQLESVDEEPAEMLVGDNNIALYDMTASAAGQTGLAKNMYYYVSFILGTIQGGINVNAVGNFCTTPEGYSSAIENFNYCAINKFNFAALATGG